MRKILISLKQSLVNQFSDVNMNRTNKIIIAVLISFIFQSNAMSSDNIFIVIQKKQEAKKNVSWNLMDWMKTKKKMALMDQWLALNTSATPFEFFLGGDRSFYDLEDNLGSSDEYNASRGKIGLYGLIFGIEGDYETSNEKYTAWSALWALRLLGSSSQGTNITLKHGIYDMNLSGGDKFQNIFVSGDITLQLASFMGVRGVYRKYMEDESNNGKKVSGNRITGIFFIDSSFLRIYGEWFKEVLDFKETGVDTLTQTREGTRFGLTFFF